MGARLKIKKIILGLVVINIIYIFISQQVTINRISQEIVNEKKEIQKINDENENLKNKQEMSKTDKYIEKLARERCKFIKQGEVPIMDSKGNK